MKRPENQQGRQNTVNRLLRFAMIFGVLGGVGIAAPLCTAVVGTAADFEAQGIQVVCTAINFFLILSTATRLMTETGTFCRTAMPLPLRCQAPGSRCFSVTLVATPHGRFSASWGLGWFRTRDSGDVRIDYSVTAPDNAAMFEASLTLTGFLTNVDPVNLFAPYIAGAESVCCPGPSAAVVHLQSNLDAPPSGSAVVSVKDSSSTHPPSNNFAGAVNALSFSKDISFRRAILRILPSLAGSTKG